MRDLPATGNVPALAVAAEGKGGRVTILVAAARNSSPPRSYRYRNKKELGE
jgi:hypothetical protein